MKEYDSKNPNQLNIIDKQIKQALKDKESAESISKNLKNQGGYIPTKVRKLS